MLSLFNISVTDTAQWPQARGPVHQQVCKIAHVVPISNSLTQEGWQQSVKAKKGPDVFISSFLKLIVNRIHLHLSFSDFNYMLRKNIA